MIWYTFLFLSKKLENLIKGFSEVVLTSNKKKFNIHIILLAIEVQIGW